MISRYQYILRYLLPVVDFSMLNLSFLVVIYYANLQGFSPPQPLTNNAMVIINLSWMFFTSILGLYTKRSAFQLQEVYNLTAKSIAYHTLIFIPYLFFFSTLEIAVFYCSTFYLTLIIFFLTSRFAGAYAYQHRFSYFQSPKKVAVIGRNGTADRLVSYLKSQTHIDYYGELECAGEIYNKKGDGVPNSLKEQLTNATINGVKLLYAAIEPRRLTEISGFLKEAENLFIHVKIIPDFEASLESKYNVSFLGDQFALVSLRKEPLEELGNRLHKRLFDILFSSLVIVFILSWLYPIIALLIKIQSPGNVIFKQMRSGRDNKPFLCYKFRSMSINSDSDNQQATKGDPRVTRIGKFLRSSSLDELPQFFNVFMGDMSVIGPRPHMLQHTEQYRQIIDSYMVRHFLKPGITGWAQVNGYRGETKQLSAMEKRVEYDIWYLENWSLFLDIKIVYYTIKALLHDDETVY